MSVICAACVCVCECDRERAVSLCWCREESQAASAVFNILILHLSSASLRTIRLLGISLWTIPTLPPLFAFDRNTPACVVCVS